MYRTRRDSRIWPVALLSVALLAIGGIVATALHAVAPQPSRSMSCRRLLADSSAMAARAADTVGRLRGAPQHATRGARDATGYSVRTEDTSRAAIHDGGLVQFDCAGHVTFVWLDGG